MISSSYNYDNEINIPSEYPTSFSINFSIIPTEMPTIKNKDDEEMDFNYINMFISAGITFCIIFLIFLLKKCSDKF